ncbi:uracil-DNA glycosylase family protein [Streptomyces stramineus]
MAAELELVDPEVVVALGASAGKSLLGSSFRVTSQRGTVLPLPPLAGGPSGESLLVATIHPSAVLRGGDADRAARYAGLVADLKVAGELL